MRWRVNKALAVKRCGKCGRELLTSVVAIPNDKGIIAVYYTRSCSEHGMVRSIKEELVV